MSAVEIIGSVNEQSASTITVAFYDEADALVVPTTIKYRIDCMTTGTAIKALADFTPAASTINISVTPTENKIQAQGNDFEIKELTVIANDGLGTEWDGAIQWRVNNLTYVTT